jgi:hypothetical protein
MTSLGEQASLNIVRGSVGWVVYVPLANCQPRLRAKRVRFLDRGQKTPSVGSPPFTLPIIQPLEVTNLSRRILASHILSSLSLQP